MGLNAALVDRARVVRNVSAGTRVEGRTPYTATPGQWFKVRLSLPSGSESQASAGRSTSQQAQVMTGRKDVSGAVLDVRASDQVEVVSAALGTYLFEVTGTPKPIRKKRRLLGWTVQLVEVDDQRSTTDGIVNRQQLKLANGRLIPSVTGES